MGLSNIAWKILIHSSGSGSIANFVGLFHILDNGITESRRRWKTNMLDRNESKTYYMWKLLHGLNY
jgi:hypothetical protein